MYETDLRQSDSAGGALSLHVNENSNIEKTLVGNTPCNTARFCTIHMKSPVLGGRTGMGEEGGGEETFSPPMACPPSSSHIMQAYAALLVI